MRRRTFLLGTAGAVSVALLAACTPDRPRPTRSPTPTPTPTTPATPTPVPKPAAFVRSRWSEDPYARGSASFAAVGASDASRDALAAPIGDRLFFAGEATSSDAPGTIAGAVASGRRAADEVMAAGATTERIAVIGAGAAGLIAARALADAGYTVTVVEARNRVGGRIASRTAGDWPIAAELGPWLLPELDADVRIPLELAGLSFTPFDRVDEVRRSDGTTVPASGVGAEAVASAVQWSSGQARDVSLAGALQGSGAGELSTAPDADGVSPADWLDWTLATSVEPRTAAAPGRLSAWNGDAAAPGDDLGAQQPDQPLGSIVAKLAGDLNVLTGSVVTRISHTETRVSLRMARGESLTVDRAIVTLPLGVLQSYEVAFSPDLPLEKRRAVSVLGVGTVDRVWLRFDERFWSTEATVLSTVGLDSPVAHWVNLFPSTGQPVLVATLAADAARRLAALDDDAALDALRRSLEPYFDPAVATPAPDGGGTDGPVNPDG